MREKVTDRLAEVYSRNRRLLNNIGGTYVVKGGSLLVSLATLPAYMRYFPDHAVLGAWFALVSILQWVLTFDLGIGNGLRNLIVPALESRDWRRVQRYVSSGYALVCTLGLGLLICGLGAIVFIDWNGVLGIEQRVVGRETLGISAAILLIGIVTQFVLRIVSSVLLAMERTALPNFLSLISAAAILLFVSLYPGGDTGHSLISLTVANTVLINAPLAVATVYIFRSALIGARPRVASIDRGDVGRILSLGGRFFWIQLMLLVASGTNEILIATWYGAAAVVEYQVYYRLFFLLVTLFSLVANPIWSAVSSRVASGRMRSVRMLTIVTLLVSCVMASANSLLVLGGQSLLDVWLGSDAPELQLFIAFAFVLWSMATMSNMAVSAIANGLGLLRVQLYCFGLAAMAKVPLAFLFSSCYPGWPSVVYANAAILLPYTIVQLLTLRRFFVRFPKSAEA